MKKIKDHYCGFQGTNTPLVPMTRKSEGPDPFLVVMDLCICCSNTTCCLKSCAINRRSGAGLEISGSRWVRATPCGRSSARWRYRMQCTHVDRISAGFACFSPLLPPASA